MARPTKKLEERRIHISFRINKNLNSILTEHITKNKLIRSRLIDKLLKEFIEKNKNKLL